MAPIDAITTPMVYENITLITKKIVANASAVSPNANWVSGSPMFPAFMKTLANKTAINRRLSIFIARPIVQVIKPITSETTTARVVTRATSPPLSLLSVSRVKTRQGLKM